jgi:hypothetical protein
MRLASIGLKLVEPARRGSNDVNLSRVSNSLLRALRVENSEMTSVSLGAIAGLVSNYVQLHKGPVNLRPSLS